MKARWVEIERLIVGGSSLISPLVLMALTKERQSVTALQRLALVANRLGAKKGVRSVPKYMAKIAKESKAAASRAR